ncbi:hypothetical protein K439DRAFT_1631719 [Ramaria rubella]|nr:hypothetical protein K439DRAFT_1631719 [Ramaria rubella]
MRYEPIPNPAGQTMDDLDAEEEYIEGDIETNELDPLAPNGHTSPTPTRNLFNTLFSSNNALHSHKDRERLFVAPATPISSDGVFTNIPAKPSSSRDRNKEDEELGEDEWIFMTPEQRKKLAPPKYSRIKRDKAPRYTTEYTPPTLPSGAGARKSKRPPALRPRINALPAGSSVLFITAVMFATFFPFLGCSLVYLVSGGRWKSHAMRLGTRTGLGLGLFHVGAMMFYIPALLPGVFTGGGSLVPLIMFLVWTVAVFIPFGWRLTRDAAREYMWVKAEERVLLERIVRANLVVAASDEAENEGQNDDVESGYRYIEGTDIRVRDLRKILARARDARLARSLRAAGF